MYEKIKVILSSYNQDKNTMCIDLYKIVLIFSTCVGNTFKKIFDPNKSVIAFEIQNKVEKYETMNQFSLRTKKYDFLYKNTLINNKTVPSLHQ